MIMMTRQAIIDKSIQMINQLPDGKVIEIVDFAEFIIKKYEDQLLVNAIQQLNSESKSFGFLNEDEDLYTVSDIKEKYNG
jgi:hypothetical protein